MWIFKQLLKQRQMLGIRVWRPLLQSERAQRSVQDAALGSPGPRLLFQLSS